MDSLTGLENGQAWFWSPQWMKEFTQIQFRRRKTFHPGETRTVGQATKQVQLSNVKEFVERFEKSLKKPSVTAVREAGNSNYIAAPRPDISELTNLRGENAQLRQRLSAAESVITNLRKHLEPEFRAYKALFSEFDAASSGGNHVNAGVFETWKEKLGKGPARLIDILLERGECTRVQLKTLAGYSGRSMTNHISSLNSNQLIEKDGDKIRLRVP